MDTGIPVMAQLEKIDQETYWIADKSLDPRLSREPAPCSVCMGDPNDHPYSVITHKYVRNPRPGDGATYSVGSDSYPYTVLWVHKNGKRLLAVQDEFVCTLYKYEQQEHVFLRALRREQEEFTLRKDGRWRRKGDAMGRGSCCLYVGRRAAYMDPCF
jgi:hypothetical protein